MRNDDYNRVVEEQADALYRFALRLMGDRVAAEDLVQEAYLRLWEKRDSVQAQSAKSYLFTTLYHAALDILRAAKHAVPIEQYQPTYEPLPYDVQERLNEGLALLPAVQRSAILLRDYEGYSYQEIGEIAQLSESQVKVYIHRGRSFLRRFLGSISDII